MAAHPMAAPSISVVSEPSTPFNITAQAGVDGVSVSWWRGSVTATASEPTSYVVRRGAVGHDLDWVVPAGDLSSFGNAIDTTLPVGLPATYTVAARNSAGDSGESSPVSATVPAWEGPYSPARKVLTMAWDEAVGGSTIDRGTTQATQDSPVPPAQDLVDSLMGFSAGPGSTFALTQDVSDGDYTVGQGAGMLAVSAVSGARCAAPNGGSPSGTASVRRSAPSLTGRYASITVDAALVCADGHRLRVELRWATPDDFHAIASPPLTVLDAQPGTVTTRAVMVTNTGSLDATLGAPRLVDADLSTSAPLTVSTSGCAGRVIAPGESCEVVISYSAGPAGSREGNGILVVPTDRGELELGRVVGQQPAALSGPQGPTATGAPGRVDLSWTAPLTLDARLISSWRVEEDGSPSPVVLKTVITEGEHSSVLTGLAVGPHLLRVVMLTRDGREISSAPMTVSVPSRWLLVATNTGVRAVDPDGGHTDGELFGEGRRSSSVAVSPVRDRVVIAYRDERYLESFSTTGSLLRLLTNQPVVGDDQPAVSPDGVSVIAVSPLYADPQTHESSLALVPAAGGPRTVVPASSGLASPSWVPDGTAVLVAQTSGAGLVKVVPSTGARTPVPGTTGGRSPAVSRTGKIAYLATVTGGTEIRVTSLAGGAYTSVGIQDGLYDLDWDPSGRWLAATGGLYGNTPHTYIYDTAASPEFIRTLVTGGTGVAWLDTSPMAPAMPPRPSATAGDGQAQVTWTASDNGGSAITGYLVTAAPGGRTATTTGGTTAAVTGLTNGTAYTFTVTATNTLGESAASAASAAVTPAGPRAAMLLSPLDFTGDARTDVLRVTPTGDLMLYRGSGTGLLGAATKIGAGWGIFINVFSPGDFTGDRKSDLLAVKGNGDLYLYRGNGIGGFTGSGTQIGKGWQNLSTMFSPGDFTGDGKSDVMGVNRATGDLYLYSGNGAGGWAASGQKIGNGWQSLQVMFSPRDFTGDGRSDVMGVNRATGTLTLYTGNGQGGWLRSGVKVGQGWGGMAAMFSPADFTGDGRSDVMGSTQSGDLYLYRGNGTGGWLGSGQRIASGMS
jgi:Fibronectin type III domain/FG-GAP-like repeat